MALAETAELLVKVNLQSNLAQAKAAVVAGVNGIARATTSLGNSLGSIGGKIKNFLTRPLSLLSYGIGQIAFQLGERLVGAFESTINKMQELAFTTEKLTGITGLSAVRVSALIAVFDKFGVGVDKATTIVAFAEKTLGKMNATIGKDGVSKLSAFGKQFGIVLTDAKGRAVDFNTELIRLANYYTSNASAAQKATVAATLFGRGFAAMIPVLKLGGQAIIDAEAAAKDLGLVLTEQNIKDLRDYRVATREAGEAVSGLQLQIGLALVPALIDAAHAATKFVRENRDNIVKFFKDAAKFAQDAGKAIQDYVLPAIQKIGDFWNSLPPDLKKVLVGGFIANKLTGGLVTSAAGGAAKGIAGLAGGALGGLLSRGGSPANPMWVQQVGGGGLPNPTSLFPELTGAGGTTLASGVAGLAPILAIVVPLAALAWAGALANGGKPYNIRGTGQGTPGHIPSTYFSKLPANQAQAIAQSESLFGKIADDVVIVDNASKHAGKSLDDLALVTGKQVKTARDLILEHIKEMRERIALFRREKELLHGRNQIGSLAGASKADATVIADALATKFAHSQAPFYQSQKNAERALAALRALQARFLAQGDTKTAAKIGRDIRTLSAAVQRRKPPVVNIKESTTVNVSTNVSTRQTSYAAYRTYKYGKVITDNFRGI